MARTIRTVAQIQQQMIDTKNQQAALAGLTSTSTTAIYRLMFYVMAVAISLLEQILNIFQAELEAKILAGAPGSASWMKQKTLEFQYSSTNPQVTTLVNFVPTYPVINPSLRIITRCSVTQTMSGATPVIYQADVKVAKGEPPTPLSSAEQTALEAYYGQGGSPVADGSGIGFCGIHYNFINQAADEMYLQAEITYNGQYSGTIQSDTINAVTAYLKDLSSAVNFNGIFKTVSLIDYMQAVPGFKDINIQTLRIRETGTSFPGGTSLVSSNTVNYTNYTPKAGYIIPETTSGNTMTNSLTFTAG